MAVKVAVKEGGEAEDAAEGAEDKDEDEDEDKDVVVNVVVAVLGKGAGGAINESERGGRDGASSPGEVEDEECVWPKVSGKGLARTEVRSACNAEFGPAPRSHCSVSSVRDEGSTQKLKNSKTKCGVNRLARRDWRRLASEEQREAAPAAPTTRSRPASDRRRVRRISG